jgi:hypothetical protein
MARANHNVRILKFSDMSASVGYMIGKFAWELIWWNSSVVPFYSVRPSFVLYLYEASSDNTENCPRAPQEQM